VMDLSCLQKRKACEVGPKASRGSTVKTVLYQLRQLGACRHDS
jgi:hypothetical protein